MKATDLLTIEPNAPSSVVAALDTYFEPFDLPQAMSKCRCGRTLGGLLGTFTWGLAHGEGYCSSCGAPARAFHEITVPDLEEPIRIEYVLLYSEETVYD